MSVNVDTHMTRDTQYKNDRKLFQDLCDKLNKMFSGKYYIWGTHYYTQCHGEWGIKIKRRRHVLSIIGGTVLEYLRDGKYIRVFKNDPELIDIIKEYLEKNGDGHYRIKIYV